MHERVSLQHAETAFIKHFPNSFRDTHLLMYCHSRGIDQFVITGMMTRMCVDTTVRAPFDFGFNNIVASQACATQQLSFHGVTVDAEAVQLSYFAVLNNRFAKVLSKKTS